MLGVYNYRADHLKEAVALALTNPNVSKALNLMTGCLSDPIGLLELQVIVICS